MEFFQTYAKMFERSLGQYVNFSKIVQESVNTAVDFNLKATKNYMEWLQNIKSTVNNETPSMPLKAEPAAKAEESVTIEAETESESKEESKVAKKTGTKAKTKNALYHV